MYERGVVGTVRAHQGCVHDLSVVRGGFPSVWEYRPGWGEAGDLNKTTKYSPLVFITYNEKP